MMTALNIGRESRLGWVLMVAAGILMFFSLGYWGGIPRGASDTGFFLQALLLLVIIGGFGLAGWHLLLRPLPAGARAPAPYTLPVGLRQRLALLMTGGIVSTVLGAVWDEQWHREYGIPFGEDFFWRPHIMIYFGFGAAILSGSYALWLINRDMRGSFQQRFRANPLLGLLILNAAFMLYALPADPIWHWTIGEDLSAWSVPHLILLASLAMTQLLAIALHGPPAGAKGWRTLLQPRRHDLLPIVGLAGLSMGLYQILLIDWDLLIVGLTPASLGLYRPEWLLAACLTGVVALVGAVATRSLKCVGAATALGLLALAMRWGMIQVLGADNLQWVAWVAALLPLFAIDLYAWACMRRGQSMSWGGAALSLILASVPNALIIRELYQPEPSSLLSYALAVITVSLCASWFTHQVATALERQPAQEERPAKASLPLSLGFSGGLFVFLLFFVATATPPI